MEKIMSEKQHFLKQLQEEEIQFVDLRFTDTLGKTHHITIPSAAFDEDFLETGKMFDGSSIKGWQAINHSDLALLPDVTTAQKDPFSEQATINIHCDVLNPNNHTSYCRDPRAVARRAEEYLKSTGIADAAYFGPEPEFFIFDDVRWKVGMSGSFYSIDSNEAAWNSAKKADGGNMGHRPSIQGGYFPVPPVDSSHNMRADICSVLEQMGISVEAHHHEVATANQNEISTKFNTLLKKADEMQIFKYVVHNVAHEYGKSATFMPKPLVGDNGSGMHCHQSLSKDGRNVFAGKGYSNLSEEALYYIGGIIKHARALNALTNPTTNSYKRLVPGFEAPVLLAYSAMNRSAAIRVPAYASPKAARIEVRFPDALANPYLAFSAMMMAGLDGIINKIHPGGANEQNLYHLSADEQKDFPSVCASLEESLLALQEDQAFLLAGNVFTQDILNTYIQLKQEEIDYLRTITHPAEFDMYYSN